MRYRTPYQLGKALVEIILLTISIGDLKKMTYEEVFADFDPLPPATTLVAPRLVHSDSTDSAESFTLVDPESPNVEDKVLFSNPFLNEIVPLDLNDTVDEQK